MHKILLMLSLALSFNAYAIKFKLPTNNDAVIGKLSTVYIKQEETFADLAERYDLGYLQLVASNPYVDPWVPKDNSEVILPRNFILPQGKREGVVINIAEYRMYFFPKNSLYVYTYPIGIGREGWESPISETLITRIEHNPSWYPPQSIIDEHLAKYGEQLPKVVEPGPNNPLGPVKLSLKLPGYLIHGSNKEFGVGMRVSHGCFRMFNHNVLELAKMIKPGTKVRIIKERFKFGRSNNKLYLEAHPPLEDDMSDENVNHYSNVVTMLRNLPHKDNIKVDWDVLAEVVAAEEGIPTEVATFY